MGIPIGAATILYVGGLLMTYLDWRYIFWFAGFGCGITAIVWHFVARNTPEGETLKLTCFIQAVLTFLFTTEHPWLSNEEKLFILANRLVNTKPKNVPYGQILRSRQFWGIAVSDMAFFWYISTSFIQMPTYLINMQGFTLADMGTLLAVAQVSTPLIAGPSSVLADMLINRGFRVKTVRQVIQAAVLIPGLVEQLWYVNHCNYALTVFIGEFQKQTA